MDGNTCAKNYTYLDLKDFRFRVVNGIPLDAAIQDHLRDCEVCAWRLATLDPSKEAEMRAFFREFDELLTPARAEDFAKTDELARVAARESRRNQGSRQASNHPVMIKRNTHARHRR